MENGKALHSGKSAEKRRVDQLRKELLVLVHDFLNEEGLFEVADAMKNHLDPLLSHYKTADNVDLSLIVTDFLAYYKMRFNKEPILVKRTHMDSNQEHKQPKSIHDHGENTSW